MTRDATVSVARTLSSAIAGAFQTAARRTGGLLQPLDRFPLLA
ncbi:MAG: hypothetical protein QNJ35_14995 [Paracoccaceae bacterium]|nr:hypothetical protein [Paracoccaceae bacterium]